MHKVKKAIIFAFSVLAFSSCHQESNEEQLMVHLDGRIKPQLLSLDIVDSTNSCLSWDLSQELSPMLHHELKNFGSLYIKNTDFLDEEVDIFELNKSIQRNPKMLNSKIANTEFISAVEIFEHKVTPIRQKIQTSHQKAQTCLLSIKARVKVFDLRKSQPELVLSEIVHYESSIPWQLSNIDYRKTNYLTTQYKLTPLALGHRHLVSNMAKKIHDYVLLAKSK